MTISKGQNDTAPKRCDRCGNYAGHNSGISDAECAYRVESTAAIRSHAESLQASPLAAADLLAHLRSVWSDPDAYKAASYVLDLGWRPSVGFGETGQP